MTGAETQVFDFLASLQASDMSYSIGPAMSDQFTLDHFRMHFQNIQKMGMKDMIGRMPGMAEFIPEGEDPEVALKRVQGMIDSMTKKERKDPDIIDAGRRRRIAMGAGVQPHEVSQFLKQFDTVRALMKQMMSMSVWQRIKLLLGWKSFRPPPPPSGPPVV
jgi:signal recognition particle subunit SRP54